MSFRERLESIGMFGLGSLALFLVLPLIILVIAVAILWQEPRIAVGIALGLLLVTAITLAVGGKGVAEELAVYAYFSLAAGVILMLIRYVGERRARVEEEEQR